MNMNNNPAPPAAASPEVFHQLGLITRQLHDALNQLGVMPKLRQSAEGLSDARSRLNYIARKTGEAADKVLTAVELAQQEQAAITGAARQLGTACAADPPGAVAAAAVLAFVTRIDAAASRTGDILTDIMLAQDFHDLTGQVVAKVVALAIDLEDSLVKLLVQAAPAEPPCKPEPGVPAGPVIDAAGRADVVADQGEVDDLLASLGF
jgi:chemotaxis protein CheZ